MERVCDSILFAGMSRPGVLMMIVSIENLPIRHAGLTPPFACLCVGAHEQEDEPAT